MATKTERILGYLPGTFLALPRPTALYSLADAFGGQLQQAENSLAALMRAHWVDHADRGAQRIDDLGRIAALYGLAPRPDEGIEEFRERLKRYIRIFLEGPSTIQGIFRVAAEALDLRIADAYEDLDTWWKRRDQVLVTRRRLGSDAARLVLGFEAASASGSDSRPAEVVGTVDLSGGIQFENQQTLRLSVDGGAPVDLLLEVGQHTLTDLIESVESAAGEGTARSEGSFLALSAPSRLEVLEAPGGDAAEPLLGLPPRTYRGSQARPALLTGKRDLGPGVDLSEERFLRLAVDGTSLAEIDCAGPDPAATAIQEIQQAINAALGAGIASEAGGFLRLTSPSSGFASTIAIQDPAANDARLRLFGEIASFHIGRDEQPARLVGRRDLSQGADLSRQSNIQLRFDSGEPLIIDCAGDEPSNTRPGEIAAAINAAAGSSVASHDGRFVSVASPTTGPSSEIVVESPSEGDASEDIFGILPRTFQAAGATSARQAGSADLSQGLDLFAQHLVKISLDGGDPVVIDLASGAENRASVQIAEVAAAINHGLMADVASHDGRALTLASPSQGTGSTLSVEPVEAISRRRFVSRAVVSSDAARAVLGFVASQAQGSPASAARLTGTPDLSRGVDLSEESFLRLVVDDRKAVEIDSAGPRAHATRIEEVVDRINQAFENGPPIAQQDTKQLTLLSPTPGAGSRIAVEPSQSADALDEVLGLQPGTHRGRDSTGIRLVGTTDLSGGVDLPADSAIRLAIDGEEPVQISLTGGDPAHKTLSQLVLDINLSLDAAVAAHDGTRLTLSLPPDGITRGLAVATPQDGTDVTETLFGFEAPRVYRGTKATPAGLEGQNDLSGGFDAGISHILKLNVDGVSRRVELRPRGDDASAVRLEQIAAAVNSAFRNPAEGQQAVLGQDIADHDGNHLILSSPQTGFSGRIELGRHTSAGASQKLLGIPAPHAVEGLAPSPAILLGQADLLQTVDLSQRRLLRLAVDGGQAVEVEVAGADPSVTTLDEIVEAVNAVFPGLASATEDDRLRLASPTTGESSRLEVLPLRFLELIEYPPQPAAASFEAVGHGDRFRLSNDGAAESFVDVEVATSRGLSGAALVNRTTGRFLRVLSVLDPGDRLRLVRDQESQSLRAEILGADGTARPVPESEILSGSLLSGTAAGTDPAAALLLPAGRSEWLFLECNGDRFDEAFFDQAHFAGGPCLEYGIFDVSRCADAPPIQAVFAPQQIGPGTANLSLSWRVHRPGAFRLNLPAELDDRFGGRFNQARFGREEDDPERFDQAVLSPPEDERFVARLFADGDGSHSPSNLVDAEAVDAVPLGFVALDPPFRQPQSLTLGSDSEKAKLYLRVPGGGGFIEVRSLSPGSWGNRISLTAGPAGPAIFDIAVHFPGGRFENARKIALGKLLSEPDQDLPVAARDFLKPGPLGIYAAKAAGVQVKVTRDRT